ncbi:MAG: acyl-CoA dehydrogenase [Ponticaulis sp.]|nr:acyl-CoA dehydrogenase [Ponticaulis sp.]
MTFVLTEEQNMLKEAARDFTAEQLSLKYFREKRNAGANGKDPESWNSMAEMGWAGVLIPEEFGGSEFGYVGLGQVLEAQGRTLAPTPLLQTALIGVSAIVLGGSDEQKATLLPKIAEGKITTALAVDETAHHTPANTSLKAVATGGAFTLEGKKTFVANGHFADLFILVARTSGEPGDTNGLTLFMIPRETDGLTVTELNTLDYHGAANLTLDGVVVPNADVLGPVDGGWAILEPVLDRACIGLAAEMLGSSEAAFEMTHEYLQTRKQFGQLIGSFQSLQHRAAIMFSEMEQTRSCIAAALNALDQGSDDISELASLAKARASKLVHLVSNETIQMHGGIGMTDEHDSGFYIKRARVQEALYGGEGYHRERYADLLGF